VGACSLGTSVMIRTFSFWFVVLVATCVVAPYALGVRPKTHRDWVALTLILAFLTWLLPGLDFPMRSF
jgi:uncharacterized membrane protein